MKQLVLKNKNEMTKRKKKKGFTLIELIIVIAIIAILAAMAIPKFGAIRKDAKVSNDVAAAKNIQTQIGMEIANGNINGKNVTSTEINSTIWKKMDGKVGKDGKSEVMDSVFKYSVDSNGNIHVYAGSYELYPDLDGNGRKGLAGN